MTMFELINRDVLIIFSKQPLFDWVNKIFPDEDQECPEVMTHDEGTVYLLPEFDHYSESIEFLKSNFQSFFEEKLFSWTTDERLWPEDLSWELFEKWFHYSIQSMVFDTLDEEIEKDDF